jgi:hypothetical protein
MNNNPLICTHGKTSEKKRTKEREREKAREGRDKQTYIIKIIFEFASKL